MSHKSGSFWNELPLGEFESLKDVGLDFGVNLIEDTLCLIEFTIS